MSNKSHDKTFFMPMLCRLSQKDTVKPPKPTNPSTTDPSSPKLTCIGQIKKHPTPKHHHHSNHYTKLHKLFSSKNIISPALDKNSFNKFKTTSVKKSHDTEPEYAVFKKENKVKSTSVTNDKSSVNKLKSKSVTMRHATEFEYAVVKKENKVNSKSVTNRSKSCNGRNNRIPINKKEYYINDQDIMNVVVDKELDPPLPVVKCKQRDQELNLWKRRGIEMKTLQIEPIQVNLNNKFRNNNGGFSLQTAAATF